MKKIIRKLRLKKDRLMIKCMSRFMTRYLKFLLKRNLISEEKREEYCRSYLELGLQMAGHEDFRDIACEVLNVAKLLCDNE